MFVEISGSHPLSLEILRIFTLMLEFVDFTIDRSPPLVLAMLGMWFMLLALKYATDLCRIAPMAMQASKQDRKKSQ